MNSNIEAPPSFHSWIVNSKNIVSKKTDRSVFLHHGSAIPKELYSFFSIENIRDGEKQPVILKHSSGNYSADFTYSNDRLRLFWKQDFVILIHVSLPLEYSAYLEGLEPERHSLLRFEKVKNNKYEYIIEFIEPIKETVNAKQRNPKWLRDELILALDLYFREPSAHGNASHPAVIELSNILNALPLQKNLKPNDKYRNPNGVGMKLANFRSFDSEYDKGLSSSSRLDRQVWDDFSQDKERLHATADAIKTSYNIISQNDQCIEDDYSEAVEGQILTRIHQNRERSIKLVKKKKKQVIQQTGILECEVCGFDFYKVYGKHGYGFIECHHIKPISEIDHGEATRLSDLAVVCANCHRMIHKSRPWLSLSELKNFLS